MLFLDLIAFQSLKFKHDERKNITSSVEKEKALIVGITDNTAMKFNIDRLMELNDAYFVKV